MSLERIRARKTELLEEIRSLELREAELVAQAGEGTQHDVSSGSEDPSAAGSPAPAPKAGDPFPLGFVGSCSLSPEEVQRYSRQMLLPSFGTKGGVRPAAFWALKNSQPLVSRCVSDLMLPCTAGGPTPWSVCGCCHHHPPPPDRPSPVPMLPAPGVAFAWVCMLSSSRTIGWQLRPHCGGRGLGSPAALYLAAAGIGESPSALCAMQAAASSTATSGPRRVHLFPEHATSG